MMLLIYLNNECDHVKVWSTNLGKSRNTEEAILSPESPKAEKYWRLGDAKEEHITASAAG